MTLGAAILNLGLNLVLIPPFGMMGAAWATAAAFLALALGTSAVGQRYYPVRYEYGRLGKIVAAGALTFAVATRLSPEPSLVAVGWHALLGLAGFPVLLALLGFLDNRELAAIKRWLRLERRRAN